MTIARSATVLLVTGVAVSSLAGLFIAIGLLPDSLEQIGVSRLLPGYFARGLLIGSILLVALLLAKRVSPRMSVVIGICAVLVAIVAGSLSIRLVTRPGVFLIEDAATALEFGNYRAGIATADILFVFATLLVSAVVAAIAAREFSRPLSTALWCCAGLAALLVAVQWFSTPGDVIRVAAF